MCQQISIVQIAFHPAHLVHRTALQLGAGQVPFQGILQAFGAITHHQPNPRLVQPTLTQFLPHLHPGGGILSGGDAVVQQRMTTILPDPHHRQDHPLGCAHALACMPASIKEGFTGRIVDRDPDTIDDQDRWRVSNRAVPPGVHWRLRRKSHAIDRAARQHTAQHQKQRFLQVAQRQPQGVEVAQRIEHSRHSLLIAPEDLPVAFGIALAQLGDVQIGNRAKAGEHAATEGAGAVEVRERGAGGNERSGAVGQQFFEQRSFQHCPNAEQCLRAQLLLECAVDFSLKAVAPNPFDSDFQLSNRWHRVTSHNRIDPDTVPEIAKTV